MDPELVILTGPLFALLGIARRLGGSRPQAGRSAAGAVTSLTAPVGRVSRRLPGPLGGIVAITVGLTEIIVGTGAGLVADGADLVVAPVVGLAGRRGRTRIATPNAGYGRSAGAQPAASGTMRTGSPDATKIATASGVPKAAKVPQTTRVPKPAKVSKIAGVGRTRSKSAKVSTPLKSTRKTAKSAT